MAPRTRFVAAALVLFNVRGVRAFACVSMVKRKRTTLRDKLTIQMDATSRQAAASDCSAVSMFRETRAAEAKSLIDGVQLASPFPNVIMPWIGYGTYRLGKDQAEGATLQAIESGYRAIDTAFIYGGETTETLVGQAIQKALQKGIINSRQQIFLTTKHWRKYHGYDPSLECLRLSLQRLQVEYVDLWLMHWPGPAWVTMSRRNDVTAEDPWHYSATQQADMAHLRSETWRAMEDACRKGLCRAIGVSNMTVQHLKTLKKTATIWPPAVNQVELHPLYPQAELLEYCSQEGIVVQAYSSLGGQDTGHSKWKELLGSTSELTNAAAKSPDKRKSKKFTKLQLDLMHTPPVLELSRSHQATPAQILLRWALDQNCPVIPKTCSLERMVENASTLTIEPLSADSVVKLREELLDLVKRNNPDAPHVESLTRLAWRRDPLRHLDFD